MLARPSNLTQNIQDQFRYDLNHVNYTNQIDIQQYNQIRIPNMNQNYSSSSCASSSSSSSSSASLLMPIIHESNDLLNCDLNLTQLQNIDDDDYVEHDLGDSDEDMDSEDDEEDEDELESEESASDNELSNFENSNEEKNKKRKRSKKMKLKCVKQDQSKRDLSTHNKFDSINNSNSQIEKNFVTIAQKDELTSQIQNGKQ